jgi:formylglycine-generating enzyme required for sulfatase activity
VPCHGRWSDIYDIPFDGRRRRSELARQYANLDADFEALPSLPKLDLTPVAPAAAPPRRAAASVPAFPFDLHEARLRQQAAGWPVEKEVDLGQGQTLKLKLIPAGEFLMGSADGAPDEQPVHAASSSRPFWMAATEITNQQYALFDPSHDSRYVNVLGMNTEERGYPVNGPRQPVVRVSFDRAMEFRRWLSKKTGLAFDLPDEEQWEWAARAGTATPFPYGHLRTAFDQWANMADASILGFYTEARYRQNGTDLRAGQQDWMLRVPQVNDHHMVSAPAGSYYPNAWGLHDMHGNVAEWTRSPYRDYATGAVIGGAGRVVVRGGAWNDRPHRCTSAFRWAYPRWQRVYNVGIRVIAETR